MQLGITELSGSLAPGSTTWFRQSEARRAPLPSRMRRHDRHERDRGKVSVANTTTGSPATAGRRRARRAARADRRPRRLRGANFFEGAGAGSDALRTRPRRSATAAAAWRRTTTRPTSRPRRRRRGTPRRRSSRAADAGPAVSSTTPATARPTSPGGERDGHLQRARERLRQLVRRHVRDERRAHRRGLRRPDELHARPGHRLRGRGGCTVTVFAAQVSDQDTDDPPDQMAADHVFAFTTTALPLTPIHDVQGAAHRSPLVGTTVNTQGVVTARARTGSTSRTRRRTRARRPRRASSSSRAARRGRGRRRGPGGRLGDRVPPGGSDSTNLSTTELTSPSTSVLSSGNPLPRRR